MTDTHHTTDNEEQALLALVEALKPQIAGFGAPWDGYTIALTFTQAGHGATLAQVDPIFYRKDGAAAAAVFSRDTLEAPALELLATQGRETFEQAILFITYAYDTPGVLTKWFWDADAQQLAITEETWPAVAHAVNPFRERPAPSETTTAADEDQRLRELASAIQPIVQAFPAQWDAFSVVLAVTDDSNGLRLHQVDPFFYRQDGSYASTEFSREALEPAAVRYAEASAPTRPFGLGVIFFTYSTHTKDILTNRFWGQDAQGFVITPESRDSIAWTANPFRPRR
ncbi:hypothetical protein FPH17_11195 [Corynebacterium godavarianum]|uniref:Uncharacterized protein n=1 Tax=Corynebacterium godavarianum TaxID=2054421 RepID=A0ABY3DY40_9CORY|nr:hypothetical protein [Corynebacterium godavarianum]MBL7285392.1 hypothetical protein [Corynebacterium godavarianum]TSJ70476.1 hypothetical protein FPH17_11195 [Corynebacterium godavarianum]